jgi:DMSO/TMAO reductase YedYZ heme-binding membrane subunit
LVAAPPGKQSWKSIQRSNYFVVTLVAAHALGYLVLEKQKLPFDTAFATCIAIAFTAQAWGYSRRRSLRADANASSSLTPRSSE